MRQKHINIYFLKWVHPGPLSAQKEEKEEYEQEANSRAARQKDTRH